MIRILTNQIIRITALSLLASTALAQSSGSVPNHAIPIGKGPGVSGFGSAIPGIAGLCLTSNGSNADPTFQSCAITDAISKTDTNSQTMAGPLILSGNPTVPLGAAPKEYVDALSAGLAPKVSVVAATTTNGTLATAYENGDTIDTVVLATGNRILIKDQSAPAENGIYTVNASGAPTRATDLDTWAEAIGAATFVTGGSANIAKGYVAIITTGGTIGVTAMPWTQNSSSTAYTAGSGLNLAGPVFSVPNLGITNAMLAGSITAAKITTGTSGASIPLTNGANTWAADQTFTSAPVFADASGTRTALGLGTAAVAATGTSGHTLPFLDGANTVSNTLTLSPTINTFDNALVINQTADGTPDTASPVTDLNLLSVTDKAKAATNALKLQYVLSGTHWATTAFGQKTALDVSVFVNGTPTTSGYAVVGASSAITSSINTNNASLWASYYQALGQAGSSGTTLLGNETDCFIALTSTWVNCIGMQSRLSSTKAGTQGTDTAFLISSDSIGWDFGVGLYGGAVKTTGTLIGMLPTNLMSIYRGIDFTGITPSDAFIVGTGFSIDPAGIVNTSQLKVDTFQTIDTGGGYTNLYAQTGIIAMAIGGVDPSNYYRADAHQFRTRNNVTTFATIDATGLALTSGEIFTVGATPGVSCASGTVNAATMVVVGGIVTHC